MTCAVTSAMSSSRRRWGYTAEEILQVVLDSDKEDDMDNLCTEEEFFRDSSGEAEPNILEGGDSADSCAENSDSEEPSSNLSSPLAKRPRTPSSIVTAIDEDYFDLFEIPDGTRWHTCTARLGPKQSKTVDTIRWTNEL